MKPIPFLIVAVLLLFGSERAAAAESAKARGDSDLSALAEQYVHLVLAMGQHDADYVDAFYGPAEWKMRAAEQKKPLDAIGVEAA
ncbi:MAG TPA: hypothetical protein VK993_12880, partial [Chthoniobacterales bacterium]|nr:hypothetical protein [Chthoniobacterales bacterium]